MKTLFIVRHGKSAWDDPDLSDHDRPLMEKGKKRTLKIANYLNKHNILIDLFVSSTAVRAFQTAQLIAKGIDYPLVNIEKEKLFYHANKEVLTDYLFGLDNALNSVMIIGHNPGFTTFANQFLSRQIEWLPTTGTVCIDFETDKWEEVMIAKRSTKFVVYPKML